LFPFKVSKDGAIEIEIYEIEVNNEIKDEAFARKLSCFDKVD
jgi:hypothetical protein